MSHNKQYISCIKIAGTPLIPPLITPKIREECLEYKLKAIDLEKKIERDRLFKKCLQDLEKLESQTKDLSLPAVMTTLENQLAFDEESSAAHVPYHTFKKLQNLKRETIDVSEYSSQGVKVINKGDELDQYSPPKLIRSNSYTLESPSPILLAHLEKEAQKCIENCDSGSGSLSPVTIVDSDPQPQQLIEADISISQVRVSTPLNINIEPQLLAALDKLPKNHAKDIMDIISREQVKNQTLKGVCVVDEKPMSVSVSSSQSLYYSISNSSTTPVPDLSEVHVVNLKNFKNQELNRQKAASIIGAAVKGYLVRRLINTERVQSLIDTIKDALLCAIQLHAVDVIDEADVELHRRLIQQVSAACYAFHEVFFSLSVKEQMGIIAMDRQRRIDKASRPLSALSSNMLRSSSKLVR